MNIRAVAIISLLILVPAIVVECLDVFHLIDLRYVRKYISAGDWWRLLTGHFDHLGWNHLGLNGLFFLLLLVLFKPLENVLLTLTMCLCSAISISTLMWFFSPNIQWYVGLSGCLYALMIYAMLLDSNYPFLFRLLALAGVLIKVVLEQYQFDFLVISEFISGPVAVDAHLYGVIVGGMFVLIKLLHTRLMSKA